MRDGSEGRHPVDIQNIIQEIKSEMNKEDANTEEMLRILLKLIILKILTMKMVLLFRNQEEKFYLFQRKYIMKFH